MFAADGTGTGMGRPGINSPGLDGMLAPDEAVTDAPRAKAGGAARPVLIAIDGRSGAGKTTLALELAALLRQFRRVSVFHLEEIYPGWNGLVAGIDRYHSTVLTPLSHGEPAQWSSWDWANHYDGELRITDPADVVILEGVGAAAQAGRELLDVVIWRDASAEHRKERALARDGDTYAPFWDEWAQQEDSWLRADNPADFADVLVTDAAHTDAAESVLRALTSLPTLEVLLAPELAARRGLEVMVETVQAHPNEPALFESLFAPAENAVWLDSSNASSDGVTERNRFSIMADDGGTFAQVAEHASGVTTVRSGGVSVRVQEPFFRWLGSQWGRKAVRMPGDYECGFALGWLGYLGYELKRETGGADIPSPHPDAMLLFAGRAVVLDHQRKCTYLLTLGTDNDSWLATARAALLDAASAAAPETRCPSGALPTLSGGDGEEVYKAKIAAAQGQIADGNSYEICLTTTLHGVSPQHAGPPLYTQLRSDNPAPFGAYLQLGTTRIYSTSPERFLRITADGAIRAEPIKGTRRRDTLRPEVDQALREELLASTKDRAENIMIVDLLRNDLSRFAVPDSLRVSRLCVVESYASVHQMVSTIDAQLRPGTSRADAVAAAFPAGSMTGAPKISTMAILDELELVPRGVYSGAVGYFSLTGAADLSVTIRTLVAQGEAGDIHYSLGAGGAITADSAPHEEWLEMQTKTAGILQTLKRMSS